MDEIKLKNTLENIKPNSLSESIKNLNISIPMNHLLKPTVEKYDTLIQFIRLHPWTQVTLPAASSCLALSTHRPLLPVIPILKLTFELTKMNLINHSQDSVPIQDMILKFKTSKLEEYARKKGFNKTYFKIKDILNFLKDIIKDEIMYDPRNPAVILLNEELSEIFGGMKGLHVTELPQIILDYMTTLEITNYSLDEIPESESEIMLEWLSAQNTNETPLESKFKISNAMFQEVLRKGGAGPNKKIFTYREITSLVSKYILARKHLIDPKNIKLAMVENDLLGQALGVKAFHRCQINKFLREGITPHNG